MATTLSDREWGILVERVESQQCTPFLGAGASAEVLPVGAQLSKELAKNYKYPFADDEDLVRVAEYIAVNYDQMYPKDQVLKRVSQVAPPDFSDPGEPHAFFARLQLPVYITTNYDDFMSQALRRNHRDPRLEICRWSPLLKGRPSHLDPPGGYVPTPANPLVYHLHGHGKSDSIVLTEDDYLEFLENMTSDPALIPGPVKEALVKPSLLFVGYRLTDWNFRVLLRCLRPPLQTLSVVVLKSPGRGAPGRKSYQSYLERYYERMQMRVFWGTAREFCTEFRKRLKAAGGSI